MPATLPLDTVLHGDCREIMAGLPAGSVDLVFADPPYNLQLESELYRPNLSRVDAVNDGWDQFDSFSDYDQFTQGWLEGCRRLLKPTGTLWVIGSYHNIYRVGKILMDLGYWILNDVAWIKSNPMPNFRGVRFTNAHETLLWAKRSKDQKRYTFHYGIMKALNGGKQMRSDWYIPLCTGQERLKVDGAKAHATQKPEALLERVIRACSSRGEVVLDPFFGAGTTGAVAKRFGRHYIGIEQDTTYCELARERIHTVEPLPEDELERNEVSRKGPRIPFSVLIDRCLLNVGQELRFGRNGPTAQIQSGGRLVFGNIEGSIHRVGSAIAGTPACNGWAHWFYHDPATGLYEPIDKLRQIIRDEGSRNGERE